jgi:hypothetical protein
MWTQRVADTLSTSILCAGLLMASVGCDHPPSNVKAELPKRAEGQAAPSVSLPEAPPSSGFVIPETNPDGTMRILGLIHNRDNHLHKEITVKGTLIQVSEDCDPAKAKKKEESCPEPFMTIQDDDKIPFRVVGFKPEFIKKAKLKVGDSYDFKGVYELTTQGFAATEDGLLLLNEVNGAAVMASK